MSDGELAPRVNLEKLTAADFRLSGEFRVRNESYKRWNMRKLEFRREGTDAYVPFDQLLSADRFGEHYELILQTPDRSEIVGSGYLRQSSTREVCFADKSVVGQESVSVHLSPLWYHLSNDMGQPCVAGLVDLIFLKVSPEHMERPLTSTERYPNLVTTP